MVRRSNRISSVARREATVNENNGTDEDQRPPRNGVTGNTNGAVLRTSKRNASCAIENQEGPAHTGEAQQSTGGVLLEAAAPNVSTSYTLPLDRLPQSFDRSLENLVKFLSQKVKQKERQHHHVRVHRLCKRKGISRLELASTVVSAFGLQNVRPLCGRQDTSFKTGKPCMNPANLKCRAQPAAWCDECVFFNQLQHKIVVRATTGYKQIMCEAAHNQRLFEQLYSCDDDETLCVRPPRDGVLRCTNPCNVDCEIRYCDSCAHQWSQEHDYNCSLKQVRCNTIKIHYQPYLDAVQVTRKRRIPSDPEVLRSKAKYSVPHWSELRDLDTDGVLSSQEETFQGYAVERGGGSGE